MATIEEIDPLDSGMGSSSDIHSPEQKQLNSYDELADDDEEDETLTERLIGLTEMFPEGVRNFCHNFGIGLHSCVKGAYSLSCSATWLFFSSSMILFAPILFETERIQVEEAQRSHQKQLLLSPNSAMSMNRSSGLPMPPV